MNLVLTVKIYDYGMIAGKDSIGLKRKLEKYNKNYFFVSFIFLIVSFMPKIEKNYLEEISSFSESLQKLLLSAYESKQLEEERLLIVLEEQEDRKLYDQICELCTERNIHLITLEEWLLDHSFSSFQAQLGKVSLYAETEQSQESNHRDLIQLYFRDITSIQLLTLDEEKELVYRIKKWDEYAKQKLISSNLRLVISIAKRYFGHRISFIDLIQEWTMGLIKAIEKFDPDKNFKFSTYATWWIKQSIIKSIAETNGVARLPVHVLDEIRAYNKANQELFQKLGREATRRELSKYLNIPLMKIKKIEEQMSGGASLDGLIGEEGKTNLGDVIEDTMTMTPDNYVEQEYINENLKQIFAMFDDREAKILKMRYGIDGPKFTLEQVAEDFNITRERVRQIEQKALEKIKSHEGLNVMLKP